MMWLILFAIILIIFSIINLIYILKNNNKKKEIFDRYEAKYKLVDSDYIAAMKVHKQFIKEYNKAGRNYQVDVKDKIDNILKRS